MGVSKSSYGATNGLAALKNLVAWWLDVGPGRQREPLKGEGERWEGHFVTVLYERTGSGGVTMAGVGLRDAFSLSCAMWSGTFSSGTSSLSLTATRGNRTYS